MPKLVWTPVDVVECVTVAGRYDICLERAVDGSSWALAKRVSEYGWVPLVRDVSQFGVRHPYVFGQGDELFFLIKLPQPPSAKEEVLSFSQHQDWMSALDRAGIHELVDMCDPSAIAASRSRQELRPWEYRFFKGLAGLSDEEWAMIVLVISIIASLTVGVLVRNVVLAVLMSVVLGGSAGFLGDSLVFEGSGLGIIGSAACAAMTATLGWLSRKCVKRWFFIHL